MERGEKGGETSDCEGVMKNGGWSERGDGR